jgi:hypothetical protein
MVVRRFRRAQADVRNRLANAARTLAAWSRDENGLETVEWLLVVGTLIVPLAGIVLAVARAMMRYYELTSWIVSLPFP